MIFKRFILFCFSVFFSFGYLTSQTDCTFKNDTLYIPKENKVINANYLQTNFKNKTNFLLYKSDNNKYYLKLIIGENLYFNKIDVLELKSGSKSLYAKDTKQYEIDKNTGYYVIEVWKNYIGTLKDDGLTAIQFGQAETQYTKQDAMQVKQIAKCFYESINISKTKQKN